VTTSHPRTSENDLKAQGISCNKAVLWNLSAPALYEETIRRNQGRLADGGALVVTTGQHTGRSPNDKFIVRDAETEETVWWGKVNAPMTPDAFDNLYRKTLGYLAERDLFVQDLYAGADAAYRLSVRVVSESPWHALFAQNMFIKPPESDYAGFAPDFTVVHAPYLEADPARDGTNSGTYILINFAKKLIVIGGTIYAGEIKKSVFSVLNYLLPARGVLPMHCSANIGPDGETAIFFGLSGTGKTTLSADASRVLIGDDEHGWSDRGIFNFEGGCYAKVIRLSEEAEPEIYATTRRFGTILENVVMDETTGRLDLDDASLTENTRASYPLSFIPNAKAEATGGQPKNIVMLTADAFGVLPPISRLTPEQAMYHFLSGYTARVAGTEKGLGSEPSATFSTCFGAPFMPRHPSVYARMLGNKIAETGANCWLVNTGWSGGAYGVGHRMRIAHTRAMLAAALDGRLSEVTTVSHPLFGLSMPADCPNVPGDVLNPRDTWADKDAYDRTARELTHRFESNFKQFEAYVEDKVRAAGIYAAA